MLIITLLIVSVNPYFTFSNSISDPEYKSYKDYRLFQVDNNGEQIKDLIKEMLKVDRSLVYEIYEENIELLVSPSHLPKFEGIVNTKKCNATLVSRDFSGILEHERNSNKRRLSRKKEFSWDAYYDVDDIYEYLKNMSSTYPEWAQVVKAAESYEGRPLLGLKIDTKQQGFNESKMVIFIESGVHGREWIAPASTTYFINQLLTSKDKDIMQMRDLFEWHIFPTVNPDGYHFSRTKDRMWRKTRSKTSEKCYGVDGNRNWDYNWMQHDSSSDPCEYEFYAGPKPFSEKETQGLSNYVSKLKQLLAYINFHSYGPMLLVPYSDSEKHFDNYNDLVKIGNVAKQYGEKINIGQSFKGPKTAAELLYKASGGSMDWVRHKLKVPLVYTFELRGFRFFWPPKKIREHGDEVTQMMLGLVTGAKNLGYYK